MKSFGNTTVVVVHGAWADGSSWEAVIRLLQKTGLNVIAAPIPLTSLSDDAAALERTIARTQGPLVLAGHAYAGAVIATSHDERIKALIYVAALAPDEGETVAQVFYKDEPHPQAPSSFPMRTVSSGCRIRGSITPLHKTLLLSRSLFRDPCNVQSR